MTEKCLCARGRKTENTAVSLLISFSVGMSDEWLTGFRNGGHMTVALNEQRPETGSSTWIEPVSLRRRIALLLFWVFLAFFPLVGAVLFYRHEGLSGPVWTALAVALVLVASGVIKFKEKETRKFQTEVVTLDFSHRLGEAYLWPFGRVRFRLVYSQRRSVG
jgi:hypothetical protein